MLCFVSHFRALGKVRIFMSVMPISSPNSMFDHLFESSHRDDSNKWSNIGFGEEITKLASIEVHFTHLIWGSGLTFSPNSNSLPASSKRFKDL